MDEGCTAYVKRYWCCGSIIPESEAEDLEHGRTCPVHQSWAKRGGMMNRYFAQRARREPKYGRRTPEQRREYEALRRQFRREKGPRTL